MSELKARGPEDNERTWGAALRQDKTELVQRSTRLSCHSPPSCRIILAKNNHDPGE
jgi:hypothetical protein